MNKSLLYLIIFTLVLTSCKKEQDPFQVSKQHIGLLTDSTQVKDLEALFVNDSIVNYIKGDEFIENKSDIEVFEKGGKKLLILSPKQVLDSTSTIGSVQIIDSRFKTDKNISTLSTFKDIQDNYTVSRINNLINSIVISVDEINASFTIDKKELPANLRFDMNLKIEKSQIPDTAKIKYFFVHWN
ncbi:MULTISPECIES: hypothetical protein [Flavobacteriaceae]|uniref:Lipoprotein n=1 Tax=Gaetbulibacter jejuensis TaxID=584607 RepID=A0ABP3UUR2_9FLAO|nr:MULTISPECIES: hypothetical protein [Flavobacteriaceae]RYH75397.1 hypothetical protein EVU94_00090 [Flavobacteriaceae bacterium 144Ye]TBV27498.1 hypothetical protein DMZ43_00105 [Meridianimaribacter sp. CL38]